jgi:secreted PhoX family phosphatase
MVHCSLNFNQYLMPHVMNVSQRPDGVKSSFLNQQALIHVDNSEDRSVNPCAEQLKTLGEVIEERLGRREFISSLALGGSYLALSGYAVGAEPPAPATAQASPAGAFGFEEIARGMDHTHHAPPGYRADVLLRWGDALFPNSPPFNAYAQTADAQHLQFGYNNDFIGYVALPAQANEQARALLCVNHEYTSTELMFPGLGDEQPRHLTREQVEVEMAAHGGSVVEIVQRNGRWLVVRNSRYNRRITAASTPMRVSGPAAGHPRLRTSEDPAGLTVAGTMNNCAGGVTPWGTYLMAEENFNGNFLGSLPEGHPEAVNHARYGVPAHWYDWGRHIDRYDVGKEPNEPNRFGWVVEVDVLDPGSMPVKRTALGRFKHEGAETVIAPDGRVVLYMGDDQRFDYLYKFVTARAFTPENPAANRDLLDEGTLYVARFDADGSLDWLPLVYGAGPLDEANGFASQADVLIETRRAADLLGATPMDRPEDVEPDPASGRAYVMLTNNHIRTAGQTNPANPRGPNETGHIIEITEPGGDFAATRSRWDILVLCGNPARPEEGATWNSATSENGWFGSPDNCAVDPQGRLWVATDGNERTGAADGIWALETEGERRGTGRAFFRAPMGAEVCGPRFAPDGRSLFLSVQHPGDGDGASFEQPATRWPDFVDGQPPRPSVVVVTREDNGIIGG